MIASPDPSEGGEWAGTPIMKKDAYYGYETAGVNYNVLRRFSKDNRRYMTPAESAWI